MTQGMKASIAALDIFAVVAQLEEKHFTEVLEHVRKSGSAYGLFWGLKPGGDPDALDLLELIGETVEFMRDLKKDKRFPMATRAVIGKIFADKGKTIMPDYLVNQFQEEDDEEEEGEE